jgi:hypothetical protein
LTGLYLATINEILKKIDQGIGLHQLKMHGNPRFTAKNGIFIVGNMVLRTFWNLAGKVDISRGRSL